MENLYKAEGLDTSQANVVYIKLLAQLVNGEVLLIPRRTRS